MSPDAKAGQRPTGFSWQENLENRMNEEKQMTVRGENPTGASSAKPIAPWDTIDWPQVDKLVKRLQMRIAKAIREGRHGKAKALQWLLTHSFYAKLKAVKRVTDNSGAKTPGVDGVLWNSPKRKMAAAKSLKRKGYHPQPLRRIYIPKSNGKLRPLSIPTMECRGQQALHLLALEPIAETIADKNAYGFRPKRSCADAIEQCFNIFSRKTSARCVLEGDIRSCFDKICHKWLNEHIPMDKEILGKWLKCGFIDKGRLFPTEEGTPQGGIASPTLLNLTLSGLEAKIASVTKQSDQVNLVVYADDFIVSGKSKDLLENTVKPVIVEFLKERGLTLSDEKTVITSIDEGFDFLGHNVRKYKGKLLIKPSKKNVTTFLRNIRGTIKSNPTAKTENLIRILNPKIIGWANFFRHVVSKETYGYVDHQISQALWRWACRRHHNHCKGWIWDKYFSEHNKSGVLMAKTKSLKGTKTILLAQAVATPIRRHVKIKADAHPYSPEYKAYFEMRDKKPRKVEEPLPVF